MHALGFLRLTHRSLLCPGGRGGRPRVIALPRPLAQSQSVTLRTAVSPHLHSVSLSMTSTSTIGRVTAASGWDSCAEKYALEAVHITGPPARQALTEGLRLLGQSENVRVGDIACGSGCVTQMASELSPVSSIVASDFSQGMVDIVTRNAANSTKPVTALVADAADLAAIPTGSLDIAIMSFALMLLPAESRERAASEMVRVVRSGGLVLFTTWADASHSQFHSVVSSIGRNLAKLTAEKSGVQSTATDADDTKPPPQPQMPYSTLDSFTQLFDTLSLQTELLSTFTAPTRVYDDLADFRTTLIGVSPHFTAADSDDFKASVEPLAHTFGRHAKFALYATAVIAIGRKK